MNSPFNRDSADADFAALAHACATRGAEVPACRSAGGIVIAGALRALREKVAALEAENRRLNEHTGLANRDVDTLRAELARLKPSGQKPNGCEHCDNLAPPGQRFCWGGCELCEDVDHEDDGCAEVCQKPKCNAFGPQWTCWWPLGHEGQHLLTAHEPSGQVAEDAVTVRCYLDHLPTEHDAVQAHFRLSTLAQEAQELRRHMPAADTLTPYEKCVAGRCGHDDAGKPGHADEVAANSEAFKEAAKCPHERPPLMADGECDAERRRWMPLTLVPDDEGPRCRSGRHAEDCPGRPDEGPAP